MKYLLDTHALLWALSDPDKLGPDARAIVESVASPIAVSAITAWELSTKHRLGKLPQADAVLADYRGHLTRLKVEELPVTSEHSLLAGALDWGHRDPFDRMLAAQAMLDDRVLITRDEAFAALDGIGTLW